MTAQTILPANTLSSGFDVANSVRMDVASGDGLERSTETPTSQRIFTFSAWVKRGKLNPSGNNMQLFAIYTNNDNRMDLRFQEDDIDFFHTSSYGRITTDRKFRDASAWYHIVLRVDTTQGTAANRFRLYVNGVQETSFSTATYPDQNTDLGTNFDTFKVGDDSYGTSHFDGYMCEVVFCDGQSLAPTSFGEFDSDSPTVWKPIKISGLTFGNIGFFLEFKESGTSANSSGIGADTSGNDNHFTVNNLTAVDQSTDTCTNNYSTLNPIFDNLANLTFSEGNLNVVASDANYRSVISTIGVSQGKWYAEFKAVSGFNSTDKAVGIYRSDTVFVATTGLGNFTTGFTFSYGATGNVRTNNGNNDTGEATFTDGDIIQVAMDLDNNKLYFGKNNTYINSGDPTTGSTGTGAYSITASTGEVFFFAVASISSGGAALWSCNFGSPAYANSSDASDANGYGAFEFAPPSGYYALNTKNLAEYG